MSDLYAVTNEVIKGWNEKRALSNLDLSGLTPFVNLISILDSDTASSMGEDASKFRNVINLDLVNDDSNLLGTADQTTTLATPLATLDIQSGRDNDVVGIESLDITRGTEEAFNVRYELKLTIMDPEVFNRRPEYSTLIFLNAPFLLIYGWTGGRDFVGPPVLENTNQNLLKIDLKSKNKGYWKAEICKLYKFDFSFNEIGQVAVTINLASPHNSLLTFLKIAGISYEVKDILEKQTDVAKLLLDTATRSNTIVRLDDTLGNVKSLLETNPNLKKATIDATVPVPTPPANSALNLGDLGESTIDQFEEGQKILEEQGSEAFMRWTNEQPIRNANPRDDLSAGQQKTPAVPEQKTAEEPQYFYLGWVLELVKYAVHQNSNSEALDFKYEDIPNNTSIVNIYNKFYKSVTDNQNIVFAETLTNVFEIPVDYNLVVGEEGLFTPSNMSIIEFIRTVVESHALSNEIKLGVKVKDGATHIFVASATVDDIETEIENNIKFAETSDKAMVINFGTNDSLCENLDLTSKMDSLGFEIYSSPILAAGVKDITVEDFIREINKVDTRLGASARRIRDEGATVEGYKVDASSIANKLMQQDSQNYMRIARALSNEFDLTWNLLGHYLKRTTIQIHGTAGINAYNYVVVRGVIERLHGIYNITQVTDQITPTSYTTILEAVLRKSFDEKE